MRSISVSICFKSIFCEVKGLSQKKFTFLGIEVLAHDFINFFSPNTTKQLIINIENSFNEKYRRKFFLKVHNLRVRKFSNHHYKQV